MKKIFYGFIGFLSMMIFLISCNKKDINTDNNSNELKSGSSQVLVDAEGFLKFIDEDSYSNIIELVSTYSEIDLDAWEKSIGYESSYTYYNIKDIVDDESAIMSLSNDFKNKHFLDPFILRLVDKNGIIQIGDLLFNLRIDEGYVLQMYDQDRKTIFEDFKNGIFNPNYMNKLTPEHFELLDENHSIYDYLDGSIVGLEPSTTEISLLINLFGKRTDLGYEDGYINAPPMDKAYGMRRYVDYQNIVFFKSLTVKLHYYNRWNSLPAYTQMNYYNHNDSYFKFKLINSNDYITKVPTVNEVPHVTSNRHKIEWKVYKITSWHKKHRVNTESYKCLIYYEYYDKNENVNVSTNFYKP